jgi:hypothetical protein
MQPEGYFAFILQIWSSITYNFREYTQNLFEVNLTFVEVKIQHNHKCGCVNSISSYYKYSLKKVCMGLSQPSGSLYGVLITAHEVNITSFIVMPVLTSTTVTYLKWFFWVECLIANMQHIAFESIMGFHVTF